jgi:hypothetical protein
MVPFDLHHISFLFWNYYTYVIITQELTLPSRCSESSLLQCKEVYLIYHCWGRHRLPCSLTRRYAAARLLGSRFEFRWEHGCWSLVCVVCCAGSGLCDELNSRSEESYRVCVIIVCDLETSTMRWTRRTCGRIPCAEDLTSNIWLEVKTFRCKRYQSSPEQF